MTLNSSLDLYFHLVNHYKKLRHAKPFIDHSLPLGFQKKQSKRPKYSNYRPTSTKHTPGCPHLPTHSSGLKKHDCLNLLDKNNNGRSASVPPTPSVRTPRNSTETGRAKSVEPTSKYKTETDCGLVVLVCDKNWSELDKPDVQQTDSSALYFQECEKQKARIRQLQENERRSLAQENERRSLAQENERRSLAQENDRRSITSQSYKCGPMQGIVRGSNVNRPSLERRSITYKDSKEVNQINLNKERTGCTCTKQNQTDRAQSISTPNNLDSTDCEMPTDIEELGGDETTTTENEKTIDNTTSMPDNLEITSSGAESHEYLHFLLRITEDILLNNCFGSTEIDNIFMNHVEANKSRLDKDKMMKYINDFKKEINFPRNYMGNKMANKVTNKRGSKVKKPQGKPTSSALCGCSPNKRKLIEEAFSGTQCACNKNGSIVSDVCGTPQDTDEDSKIALSSMTTPSQQVKTVNEIFEMAEPGEEQEETTVDPEEETSNDAEEETSDPEQETTADPEEETTDEQVVEEERKSVASKSGSQQSKSIASNNGSQQSKRKSSEMQSVGSRISRAQKPALKIQLNVSDKDDDYVLIEGPILLPKNLLGSKAFPILLDTSSNVKNGEIPFKQGIMNGLFTGGNKINQSERDTSCTDKICNTNDIYLGSLSLPQIHQNNKRNSLQFVHNSKTNLQQQFMTDMIQEKVIHVTDLENMSKRYLVKDSVYVKETESETKEIPAFESEKTESLVEEEIAPVVESASELGDTEVKVKEEFVPVIESASELDETEAVVEGENVPVVELEPEETETVVEEKIAPVIEPSGSKKTEATVKEEIVSDVESVPESEETETAVEEKIAPVIEPVSGLEEMEATVVEPVPEPEEFKAVVEEEIVPVAMPVSEPDKTKAIVEEEIAHFRKPGKVGKIGSILEGKGTGLIKDTFSSLDNSSGNESESTFENFIKLYESTPSKYKDDVKFNVDEKEEKEDEIFVAKFVDLVEPNIDPYYHEDDNDDDDDDNDDNVSYVSDFSKEKFKHKDDVDSEDLEDSENYDEVGEEENTEQQNDENDDIDFDYEEFIRHAGEKPTVVPEPQQRPKRKSRVYDFSEKFGSTHSGFYDNVISGIVKPNIIEKKTSLIKRDTVILPVKSVKKNKSLLLDENYRSEYRHILDSQLLGEIYQMPSKLSKTNKMRE